MPGHPRRHFRRIRTWMPGTRPGMTVVVLSVTVTSNPSSSVPTFRSARRHRRAHAAGAVEDEFLVLLEDRLGIGARRIDPEFKHAAGAGERAGNLAVALDLAGIADIDDHDIGALRGLDRLRCANGLDLGIGFVDQGFDTAVNGLGHLNVPLVRYLAAKQVGSLSRRERVGVRGYGLSIDLNPSPGSPKRSDLSRWER